MLYIIIIRKMFNEDERLMIFFLQMNTYNNDLKVIFSKSLQFLFFFQNNKTF